MTLRGEASSIAEGAAIAGGSIPLQSPAHARRRRVVVFASIGVAAYLAALIATVPASLVALRTPGMAIGGTIWNGEAALVGGNRVDWSWAPLRSLAQLGFALDWRARGPATDLAGRALLKPGRVILQETTGSADGSLLDAIAPDLPFTCAMMMQVDLSRVAIGGEGQGFSGEIRSKPGACRTKGAGGLATPVPALIMIADRADQRSTVASIAPLDQPRHRLVKITLGNDGRLVVGITPAGAAKLPFISPRGGMRIETEL